MAEWILGVGRQKSLREIVAIGEKEIIEKEGPPRRLTLRSSSVEMTADRPDYEGPWTNFSLRAHAKGHSLECMEKIAADFAPDCDLVVEDNWHILRFPAPASTNHTRALEALDTYSNMLQFPEVWRVRGEKFRLDPISVELLFKALVEYKASDVHLSPGEQAMFRVDGEIAPSEVFGVLSAPQILAVIREVAQERDWNEFQENKQASFNFHQAGLGYSRVSCFVTSGAPHLTFRYLPERIPSFEDLHLPVDLMETLAELHHGLVLLVGMTGSGKSTTVAALVDYINAHHTSHILTIENPVEYVYHNRKALISQRNLGTDVATFGLAVTGALRHDPDVIVIGEMRDPDTIRAAINAAATGHLVISTLHSNTAFEVVNRIVSFFDPVERDLVKLQIRDCMRCVICQRLVPKAGGGRIPAIEVLFNDVKAINDAVMLGDTDGIRVGMQQTTSRSWIFENYLFRLQKEGKITLEQARAFCTDVSILDQMLMGTYSVPRLESIKHAGAQK
ncbi:MAG: PilT/PilU family type 4a pilus ATPase [Candidatus Hydrogenedentes bacterium]|nr:PilT/PilU family type 4a pilus ATPase [Candidatus Hydrogenedentota bacterium]